MKFISFINESEKKFWNDIYKNNQTHWLDKKPSRLVSKIISKYKKFGNVLEIGCAAGIDTFELAKISNKIIGIDIVSDAIKKAKENLETKDKDIKDKITFEIGDAENLKYDDNIFDFVYSLSVLHSTDPSKSLKEIYRVLKENGKAVIYIFIGDKEGANKDLFLKEIKKYFIIIKQEEIEIKDKGDDNHKALILWLEKI